jgi:hypothetical protein
LNILEGKTGESYADWNNNGRPENPGDDVGLLPYVRLLEAAGAGAAISEEQRGGTGEKGRSLAALAAEIADQLLNARETVRRIVLTDTVDEIRSSRLDTELAAALGVKGLIDQALAQAADMQLAFAIELLPAP